MPAGIRRLACIAAIGSALFAQCAAAGIDLDALRQVYAASVDRKLDVPAAEVDRYAQLVQSAFDRAGIALVTAQYVVAVDRNPNVQAAFVMWRSRQGEWRLAGASPVSTGRPGSFDHFLTPVGIFEHTTANMDFRAEGTFNDNGIRGYGLKGMRVYDFGWQHVPKGWGDGKTIEMRLQMHATDPATLEQRLGTTQSKGCIRVPAKLNALLDHYGVIDAAYDAALAQGQQLWVLAADREPVEDAGRWLVVLDTGRSVRPDWAVAPSPARGTR